MEQSFGRIAIAGTVGGVIGGVASLVVWLIAAAIGMPTLVNVTGQGLMDLMWFQFILLSLVSGLLGGVVAGLLRKRGFQTFNIIAIIVLVLSMAGPVAQPGEVAWSTRIVLMATHVIVYITVVQAIKREMSNG